MSNLDSFHVPLYIVRYVVNYLCKIHKRLLAPIKLGLVKVMKGMNEWMYCSYLVIVVSLLAT